MKTKNELKQELDNRLEDELMQELENRFKKLFEPNTRLLAIHLNGFSHTVFYDFGKKEDNIESKHYSQYASTFDDKFDDKLYKLFNGIPHYIYQGNPLEIVYVCPEER